MRQSIKLPHRLPPWLPLAALAIASVPTPGQSQDLYRVIRQENFRREPRPDARLLAQVRGGSELAGTDVRGGWVQITLEGWIWSASIEDNPTGEFDAEVSARGGENLRTGPNEQVIARLGTGFLLEVLEESNGWTRVRRRGWMWGRSLELVTQSAAPASAPAAPATQSAPPETPEDPDRMDGPPPATDEYSVTDREAALRLVPDGDSTALLVGSTPVRLLERREGWVRVRVEGWVAEDAIRPSSGEVLVGVSGAEVRARPSEFEGRVVQWVVQYIAMRTADDLRAELPIGQRYILVRGPVPEAGFAYVIVNDEQADALEEVAPLAHLVIDAQIRVSRSRYLSNTVLELINFSVRKP